MQRRTLLKSSVALAGVPLLGKAGLRSSAAQDLSGSILLWHGWTGAEADTLNNEVLPAFTAANPNVKVDVLAVPFDQLKAKFVTEASAGGGPDVLIGPLDWVGELATGEAIQALDEWATADVLSGLVTSTVDALKYDGKLYGLPESFECVAMYYNKSMMAEPVANTADLDTAAGTMAADTYAMALHTDFYHPAGFLFGFGGTLFDAEYNSTINSPETVAFLNWIAHFNNTPGLFQSADDATITSLFKEGKAASVVNGPWASGDFKAVLADNLAVAPMPLISEASDAAPTPFLGVKHIMMSANAEGDQAALAFAFMQFFTGPEAGDMLAKGAGHLPANTAVDVSADPIAAGFVEQAKNVVPMPTVPEMGQVWEPAGNMITSVISGDATAEEAAATAQDTINKGIEEIRAS